jgi:hypothetical protein
VIHALLSAHDLVENACIHTVEYIVFAPAGQNNLINPRSQNVSFKSCTAARFASTVHGRFGPTVVRKTIRKAESVGEKHKNLGRP